MSLSHIPAYLSTLARHIKIAPSNPTSTKFLPIFTTGFSIGDLHIKMTIGSFSHPMTQIWTGNPRCSSAHNKLYNGRVCFWRLLFLWTQAEGLRFRIYYKGKPVSIGGTSASSPAFAGFVSLLNDVRLSQGLSPLGFLNPFLYSKGFQGLNDITAGNNPGCGTPGFTVGGFLFFN